MGKKIVSICASSKLSLNSGYLQYRFGPKDAPELLQPDPATPPKTSATAKAFPYAGGGGAYMRFTKGVYSYVVYSGIGKGWKQEGVAVEKDGKVVANLICKGVATSDSGFGLESKSSDFGTRPNLKSWTPADIAIARPRQLAWEREWSKPV